MALLGRAKKNEKGSTKGLIELKQEEIAQVEVEITALMNECNDLWHRYKQYRDNGETLKALEAKSQREYKLHTVKPDLDFKHQQLINELGGVDFQGYRTGLVGEVKDLEFSIKSLKIYRTQIKEEKLRLEERIESINRDIEETEAKMESTNQRLKELLGS